MDDLQFFEACLPQEPFRFSREDIEDATNHFDCAPASSGGRLLGSGGFGKVYAGHMQVKSRSLVMKPSGETEEENVMVPVAVKTLDQVKPFVKTKKIRPYCSLDNRPSCPPG